VFKHKNFKLSYFIFHQSIAHHFLKRKSDNLCPYFFLILILLIWRRPTSYCIPPGSFKVLLVLAHGTCEHANCLFNPFLVDDSNVFHCQCKGWFAFQLRLLHAIKRPVNYNAAFTYKPLKQKINDQ